MYTIHRAFLIVFFFGIATACSEKNETASTAPSEPKASPKAKANPKVSPKTNPDPRSVTTAAPATSDHGTAAAPDTTWTLVAAGTCPDGYTAVSKDQVSKVIREDNSWRFDMMHGCGCPSGPVFTVAYQAKTSPLEVVLCMDQSKDGCEMACPTTGPFDLSAALTEAGATDILLK